MGRLSRKRAAPTGSAFAHINMNHYDWLEENLLEFARIFGVDGRLHKGAIAAHGDKCYGYEEQWKTANIPFPVGVAIYLLSYHRPYSESVRDTSNGWVAPDQWVVKFFNDNRSKLVRFLPPDYRYFMDDTTLWRVVSGSPPEWRDPQGVWQPNERRTSLRMLIDAAVETDQHGVPIKTPPDPEEAPGSRNDFIRRVEHVRYYLEQLLLPEQVRKDLNKLLYGYEPDGEKPLTKDSPKRCPNWRLLEARMKHG